MNKAEGPENLEILSIPDWQRRIINERLVDIDQEPDDEQTWEEVKGELWPLS
jgi:hypothetical protein